MNIPFNKPYLIGNEIDYIDQAIATGKLSGNGKFTKKCQSFFENKYGFLKTFLTTSCTDALEMCAILLDIKPNDEVIMPSFTFVSTANAFVLRGANIVFCDSEKDNPNIDANAIEQLITEKTKAIVVVHYAGVACDMDQIMSIAKKNNLFVVEDAAQAIDSYYKGKPLGGIGHLGAFSFHETKNISAGEGGMLIVNDERFIERAEVIWEKGTNRTAFFRGEVDKYGWVDIGSSFLPSEITAAFLWAQLEQIDDIQSVRKSIWEAYWDLLSESNTTIKLPSCPEYATNNAHMFYLLCSSIEERTRILASLKENGIHAVFHYQGLHDSQFYIDKHDGRELPNCDFFTQCLIRLPLYYELPISKIKNILKTVLNER